MSIYNGLDLLERILDGKEKPSKLELRVLRHITDNFSDNRIIGQGGCGAVYRGDLDNRRVAVKKLLMSSSMDLQDKMFQQEFSTLMAVDGHENIARFIGHCSCAESEAIHITGKFVLAEVWQRLLVFEYVSNGSLDRHVTDELRGLEWHTRYQIIKGICNGLHHLHKEKDIVHMDLKPANILLDDKMIPKITDFGISKSGENSQTLSLDHERLLSVGYCAPEYQGLGNRSIRSDIYSLGKILLEVVTGCKKTPNLINVLRKWRYRWKKSGHNTPMEYQQVKKCIELAERCLHEDPTKRPFIWEIILELSQMDNEILTEPAIAEIISGVGDMLGIQPLKLHFPLDQRERISHSVLLTNDTDDYIAFWISTMSSLPYCLQPNKGVVPPHSCFNVMVSLEMKEKKPHYMSPENFRVRSTRVDGVLTEDYGVFTEERGKVVDEVSLMVVHGKPESTFAPCAHKGLAGASSQVIVTSSKKLLQVDPVELRYYPLDLNSGSSSSLCLTNNTHSYVAFMFSTFSKVKYSSELSKGTLPPWSTWGIVLRAEGLGETLANMGYKDNVLLRSAALSADMNPEDISAELFDIKKGVHEVELEVVFVAPAELRSLEPVSPSQHDDCEDEIEFAKLQLNSDKGTSEATIPTSPGSIETDLLEISPLELRFPFKPDEPIRSVLNLVNKTDDEVHFCIISSKPKRYVGTEHWEGIVSPHSTCAINVEMKKQQHKLESMDQFRIFMGTNETLRRLLADDLSQLADKRDRVLWKVKEEGGKAHEVSLMAIICDPEPDSNLQIEQSISMEDISGTSNDDYYGKVLCIDVHPTELWVVTYNSCHYICLWNADQQDNEMYVPCIEYNKRIHSLKFIPRMQWIVCGDADGCICVYTYGDTYDESFHVVKQFEAHHKDVVSLVAHPTLPCLLSSSSDTNIKLWNWDRDWECTREFNGHTDSVHQLSLNPNDIDTFASISNPLLCSRGRIKIWRGDHTEPIMEMITDMGNCIAFCHFIGSDKHHMAIGEEGGNALIWDIESQKCVHAFRELRNRDTIEAIGCHPTLPLLITITSGGDAFVWNTKTNRLIDVILLGHGKVKGFGFMEAKGIKRLVIGYENTIEILEINY